MSVMNTFDYVEELGKIDQATTPEQLASLDGQFRARFYHDPDLPGLLHALHMTALARYGASQWAGYVARPASQPTLQALQAIH